MAVIRQIDEHTGSAAFPVEEGTPECRQSVSAAVPIDLPASIDPAT